MRLQSGSGSHHGTGSFVQVVIVRIIRGGRRCIMGGAGASRPPANGNGGDFLSVCIGIIRARPGKECRFIYTYYELFSIHFFDSHSRYTTKNKPVSNFRSHYNAWRNIKCCTMVAIRTLVSHVVDTCWIQPSPSYTPF